ncbi:Homoserine/homoserine lactone efflux protein [Klebsiella michiganensis]|nr:Homoserine/homoserine lactone efflux protein [Klebsiella michiganensis]
MQQLYLYILIASLTIASPGPGVLLTLTNTLNYNLRNAMAGIIGVAVGMGVISIIAASSVGVMITTSQLTLLIVKGIGGGLSDLSGRKALSLGAPHAESTSLFCRFNDAFRQPAVSSGSTGVVV